jgi:hypothetical protein
MLEPRHETGWGCEAGSVSSRERQRAKLNRARREQSAGLTELDAMLAEIGWPTGRGWGSRGPRGDPLLDVRDFHVATLVMSARAAGVSYEAALKLGARALASSGIGGASSTKTVEAILARRRRLLDRTTLMPSEAVETAARKYGMAITVGGIKPRS